MTTNLWVRSIVVAGAVTGGLILGGCNREAAEPPSPAPAPVPVAQPAAEPVARVARPVVSKAVAIAPVGTPLAERAQSILAPGADVTLAAQGFRSPQQFMAVAYASKNLDIPFVLLKDKVLTKKMTLARAISVSTKGVNPTLEAQRAESEARAELARKNK
jgi:hypothetical protein